MEGKDRNSISETFGKYTGTASYGEKGGYNKVREPKNITSDMWAPISTGEPMQKKRSAPVVKSENRQDKHPTQNRPISEGRSQTAKPNKNSNAPAKKGAENKRKPENGKTGENKKVTQNKKKVPPVSRTPKGKPVSQKNAAGRPQNNVQPSKKRTDKAQQENAKRIRQQQKLNKENRNYDDHIKQGKSPNEISKQRAAAKRKRRRIRSVITVILFLVFVCAFVGIYSYTKGAPIANIIVSGESIYKNEQIIESAEIYEGLNMLSLREKDINKKVSVSLPYIHSVELERTLPDTVTLTVTPTKEKYLIVNDSGYICVDEHEKILSLKKIKLQDGMFRIYGFEAQQVSEGEAYEPSENNKEKYELIKEIVSAIESTGVMNSATVNVTDMSDVQLLYNGKVMIYLGDCDDLANQIELACNVIKTSVTNGQTGYIDMRYDGMAFFNEGTMKAD